MGDQILLLFHLQYLRSGQYECCECRSVSSCPRSGKEADIMFHACNNLFHRAPDLQRYSQPLSQIVQCCENMVAKLLVTDCTDKEFPHVWEKFEKSLRVALISIQWQLVTVRKQHLTGHESMHIHAERPTGTMTTEFAVWYEELQWCHILPSGGEMRVRLVLRKADPLSKYLMNFHTVALFYALSLQNNHEHVGDPNCKDPASPTNSLTPCSNRLDLSGVISRTSSCFSHWKSMVSLLYTRTCTITKKNHYIA